MADTGKIHPLLARLIETRKARGVTQTEIATRTGMSKAAICEMEHGYHEPRMRTFIGYAEALGFDVLPDLTAAPAAMDDEPTGQETA